MLTVRAVLPAIALRRDAARRPGYHRCALDYTAFFGTLDHPVAALHGVPAPTARAACENLAAVLAARALVDPLVAATARGVMSVRIAGADADGHAIAEALEVTRDNVVARRVQRVLPANPLHAPRTVIDAFLAFFRDVTGHDPPTALPQGPELHRAWGAFLGLMHDDLDRLSARTGTVPARHDAETWSERVVGALTNTEAADLVDTIAGLLAHTAGFLDAVLLVLGRVDGDDARTAQLAHERAARQLVVIERASRDPDVARREFLRLLPVLGEVMSWALEATQ